MSSLYVMPVAVGAGGPYSYGYETSYYGGFPVVDPSFYQTPLDPGHWGERYLPPLEPLQGLGLSPPPVEPGFFPPPPPPLPPPPMPIRSVPSLPSMPIHSVPSLSTLPSMPMRSVPSMPTVPSCLLTPPPTPEPTVWVRPRLGRMPVCDPRTLAEVHGPSWVQQWTKGLRLEDGLVAVHVRHEDFTVEPAFPGPISRQHVVDPAGVLHVCISIREFSSQVEYGMYVVWVTCFAELFNRTGQHWALVPQPPSTPKPSHIWRSFSTSAKIRFRCETCQNAWTSMHGQVAFQYFLHKGPGAGTVFFQLFGQKCRVCVRQRQRQRERARTAGTAAPTATATTAVTAVTAVSAATATTAATTRGTAAASVEGPRGAAAASVEGPRGAAAASVEGPRGAVAASVEGAVAAAPMTPPPEEEGAAAPAPAQPAAARFDDDDVPYANPMWYPDEVRRVLLELYCQVTAKLYPNMPRPQPPSGHQRRFGRPQQAHDPTLCQGCTAGTCRMLKRR